MTCENCNCDKCLKFRNSDVVKREKKVRLPVYKDGNQKLCSKCKVYKGMDQYYGNGKGKKVRSECTVCRKETNRITYLKRKAKLEKLKNCENI